MLKRARVLVVDDDTMVARGMSRMLRRHDVEIDTDATRALARIVAGDRFDVIFCDLTMPVLPGWELHARITDVAPDQADRMVFVTGGAYTEHAMAFLARTTNARLVKPCTAQQLEAAVTAQLGATTATARSRRPATTASRSSAGST